MFNPLTAIQDAVLARHVPEVSAQRRDRKREWFAHCLQGLQDAELTQEEIDAHLHGMPGRYWDSVDQTELIWGVETIHKFFREVAQPDSPATMPVIDVRHRAKNGATQLMLCTWDRQGLLAKVAGCLSAMRINILQADVYTRADGVVLDTFRICEPEGQPVSNATRLQELGFLIEGALSEPPRFASLWACSRHKFLSAASMGPPFISFDNLSWPDATVLTVTAPDRLGLLYDILAAMADLRVNICHAVIDTEDDLARDMFYVVDPDGRKISEAAAQQHIRATITNAVAS
jgi:[protein-PII] uridylyltransferase